MTKRYCKRLEEYEEPSEFDEEGFLEVMKSIELRKKATGIALEKKVFDDLKEQANKRDVSYQSLIRVFVKEGLKRLKRSKAA